MIHWIVAIFALAAMHGAFAQLAEHQVGADVPAGLVQKQVFARSLIEDISLEKRILDSQDIEAKRIFELARACYNNALAALDGRDFASADKLFGEAMVAIGKVRRRVPDVEARTASQRAAYERQLLSVESLNKSYLSYQQRGKLASSESGNEEQGRTNLHVAKLLESARTHALQGRLGEALQALEKAEQMMKSGIGRILGAATLDYTQKFDKLTDEFAYELERNRSYLALIPVAVAELKPVDEIKANISDLIEQNRVAIEQANKFARAQDYAEALSSVRVGIGYLRNAMTLAGLLLPLSESE